MPDYERPQGKRSFREKLIYESIICKISAFECFIQYEFDRHGVKVELNLEFTK